MYTYKSLEYGYTPKLSKEGVFILRRLAWFKKQPMTKTLDQLVLNAVQKVNIKKLCSACKGTKDQCFHCVIMEGVATQEGKSTPKT